MKGVLTILCSFFSLVAIHENNNRENFHRVTNCGYRDDDDEEEESNNRKSNIKDIDNSNNDCDNIYDDTANNNANCTE